MLLVDTGIFVSAADRDEPRHLERIAGAVGADLVVGVGENLATNRSIAKLEREGHAVVRRAG